jgi:AraC-like DNA-binding protein
MHYEEFRPEPALAPFIHCYWLLSDSGTAAGDLQPIVPDGRMEIVVNLADRFLRHHRAGTVERQPASLLAGQITSPILVQPGAKVDLVGIRFRPAGAATMLPIPPGELRDHLVDPSTVEADLIRDLPDQLHAAGTIPARLQTLNRHFTRLRPDWAEPDRAVDAALDHIVGSHGLVRMGAVAAQLGMTRRTLERRFEAGVGMRPKLFARITRFQRAFRRIQQTGPGAFSHVAHRCGYYDQAHLIRDFRDFAGTSPSRFFAASPTLADFFSGRGDSGAVSVS